MVDDVSAFSSNGNNRGIVAAARAISRRQFLQNMARWGLAVGVGLSAPLALFHGRAEATSCSVFGVRSTWGCNCANTMTCPSCGSSGTCGNHRKRCTQWGTAEADGNYCWCSLTCCRHTCKKGYFVCCDCWDGGSGGCLTADDGTACICRHLHVTCEGTQCGCTCINAADKSLAASTVTDSAAV